MNGTTSCSYSQATCFTLSGLSTMCVKGDFYQWASSTCVTRSLTQTIISVPSSSVEHSTSSRVSLAESQLSIIMMFFVLALSMTTVVALLVKRLT